MSTECRAVCATCLGPVLRVQWRGGPLDVEPEPADLGPVLVGRGTGIVGELLTRWESDRTVVDTGRTVRFELHRCTGRVFDEPARMVTVPETMLTQDRPPQREVTRAERAVLRVLEDGGWHKGTRTVSDGSTVLSQVAAALWRRGLVNRRGASRGPKPSNPGFEYRINDAGKAMLERRVDA